MPIAPIIDPNITNVSLNVTHNITSNVSGAINETMNLSAPELLKQMGAITTKLHFYKFLSGFTLIGFVVLLLIAFLMYWKYIGRYKHLAKKGYGWIHLFLKSGRIKSFFANLTDAFNLGEYGTYFSDPTSDVIEIGSGIHHRFFFEGSPVQIKFVPTGVTFNVPETLPDYLKEKFTSLAPKVIHIKSDITSTLIDQYLQKASRFGSKLVNLSKFRLNKETAIAVAIVLIIIFSILKSMFGGA